MKIIDKENFNHSNKSISPQVHTHAGYLLRAAAIVYVLIFYNFESHYVHMWAVVPVKSYNMEI